MNRNLSLEVVTKEKGTVLVDGNAFETFVTTLILTWSRCYRNYAILLIFDP